MIKAACGVDLAYLIDALCFVKYSFLENFNS